MNIETKFEMGQKVYRIHQPTVSDWEPCGFCADGIHKGEVEGADGQYATCPRCYGRGGKNVNHHKQWQVGGALTLGRVRLQFTARYVSPDGNRFSNYGDQSESLEEEYMAYETGIGSGNLWRASELFATHDEAQAECDKRNAVPEPIAV